MGLGYAGGLAAARFVSGQAAPLPAEWQHEHRSEVSAPALVRLSLPLATLDAARPALQRWVFKLPQAR